MRVAVTLLLGLAAACAPLSPEELAARQQERQVQQVCRQEAKLASGTSPELLDEGQSLSQVYVHAYRNCLARDGG